MSPPQAAAQPSVPAPAEVPRASPPPARELTPAEISALQSVMTDRSGSAILTPGNVGAIRNRVIDAQRAATTPAYADEGPPRIRPRLMSVQPQVDMAAPQTVHLAFGMVTPITILDAGGRPWPIAASAYDPRSFAVDGGGCGGQASAPAERPTTIHIMPCRVSTYGNISITLENYPLPIVLIVRSGGRGGEAVDLPVTIEVRGRAAPLTARSAEPVVPANPAAAAMRQPDAIPVPPGRHTALAAAPDGAVRTIAARSGRGRAAHAPGDLPDRLMDEFGLGTPPRGAARLRVDDPAVSAWMFGGRLYVRGPVVVVNPVQDAMAQTPDGVRVWRFDRPVPRLLVTDADGRERAVTIDD
ncbi:DotH/IcmK family type IV secretion protein [Methylobacterium indicum]|uniref:DotH/IcmK family type IV secretion protein n=1 Tax=Methylobacterium indicum TaxID=1775910 RepID=UPI000734C688|nr:DotH/IcmK family type IV secretion protein [Methylobacterium indicum]